MVAAKVINGPKHIICTSIVDSGADTCLFPFSFLKILGLDQFNLPMNRTRGVGSSTQTFYASVVIQITGVPDTFTTYAGFTVGLDGLGYGLLGQSGFFENYRVTLSHPTKKFHIDTL